MEQNSSKKRKSIIRKLFKEERKKRKTRKQRNPLKKRKTIKQNPFEKPEKIEQPPCCEAKPQDKLYNPWKNLPKDILDLILYSSIDFSLNESVVTISDTTFDIKLCDPKRHHYYCGRNYWNILNNLFMIFALPSIDTFRLHLTDVLRRYDKSTSIIDSWAVQLRRTNVKHFTLKSDAFSLSDDLPPYGARYVLDMSTVFQIHSLVSLDLDLFAYEIVSSVRASVNLPHLKKLSLTMVTNYQVVEWLVNSCPTLEDFSLTVMGVCSREYHNKCCDSQKDNNVCEDKSISVLSTSLKRLCISLEQGSGDIEFIIDAPNLEHFDFAAPLWSISSKICMSMLNSVSHVKSLYLDIDAWTSRKTIIFPNLNHLTWVLGYPYRCQDVVSMLQACPKLKVLVLKQNYGDEYWDSFLKNDIFIPLEHVKRIELVTDNDQLVRQFLSLATFLLRSAPILKKLNLRARHPSCLVKARDVETLLKSPRLSPHCEIKFIGSYKRLFRRKG